MSSSELPSQEISNQVQALFDNAAYAVLQGLSTKAEPVSEEQLAQLEQERSRRKMAAIEWLKSTRPFLEEIGNQLRRLGYSKVEVLDYSEEGEMGLVWEAIPLDGPNTGFPIGRRAYRLDLYHDTPESSEGSSTLGFDQIGVSFVATAKHPLRQELNTVLPAEKRSLEGLSEVLADIMTENPAAFGFSALERHRDRASSDNS